eukprot:CAMPEP_0183704644 /NCGR_PEP_ID=MMETSP0737-20130205/1940_1 /TAXON_ID=385413 /ORGANISM="Thalassiosira miniscula, Strain CCMP1093" /LENGTH=69 /DNA_ID=CAMNT_0025931583 /DNA_START=124 /DNA_END=330 /DNA_ORIENTATION=-
MSSSNKSIVVDTEDAAPLWADQNQEIVSLSGDTEENLERESSASTNCDRGLQLPMSVTNDDAIMSQTDC